MQPGLYIHKRSEVDFLMMWLIMLRMGCRIFVLVDTRRDNVMLYRINPFFPNIKNSIHILVLDIV